jgi:hypothetical protein
LLEIFPRSFFLKITIYAVSEVVQTNYKNNGSVPGIIPKVIHSYPKIFQNHGKFFKNDYILT